MIDSRIRRVFDLDEMPVKCLARQATGAQVAAYL